VSEGALVITRAETWGAALAIGLVATTFTFQVMYRILPRVGATNFSATTFIAPVSAIVFGFLLLGEIIQPTHLLGMIAIFIGLLMIDGRLPRWLGMRRAAN
jgi:drug/metabolite transporter (DMT)-like permease